MAPGSASPRLAPADIFALKINLGIAMRMAALMRLHREETYAVPKTTPEMVMQAESARRTIVSTTHARFDVARASPALLCYTYADTIGQWMLHSMALSLR